MNFNNLIDKYGIEGYSVYWFLVSNIKKGEGLSTDKFPINDYSRLASDNLNLDQDKVVDIIAFLLKSDSLSSSLCYIEAIQSLNKQVPGNDAVLRIFNYWIRKMGKRGKTVKLTPKRRTKINSRLRDGYTEDEIKKAIENCALSEFHMGDNDRGVRYNDIELILRDGGKLEYFRDEVGGNNLNEIQRADLDEIG